MAQDGYRRRPLPVVVGGEEAPELWLGPQHFKELRRDHPAEHPIGRIDSREDKRGAPESAHLLETLCLCLPIEEVWIRYRDPPALMTCFIDHHETVGVGIGQRLQQYGVDDAEDCRVSANSQGNHRDGYHRDTGGLQ